MASVLQHVQQIIATLEEVSIRQVTSWSRTWVRWSIV
jgi:hypothetical protein